MPTLAQDVLLALEAPKVSNVWFRQRESAGKGGAEVFRAAHRCI
jgi:hypothetical protein